MINELISELNRRQLDYEEDNSFINFSIKDIYVKVRKEKYMIVAEINNNGLTIGRAISDTYDLIRMFDFIDRL